MTVWLYRVGLAIDAALLLLACGNALMMRGALVGSDGVAVDVASGLTTVGWLALWGIPLLPFGLAALLWGGLAVVFAVFSRR